MIQRYSTVIQSCVSLTQWLRIGDMTCEQAHSSGRSDQSRTVDPAIRRRDFLAAQSTCIDHRSLPPTVIGSALQLKKSFGCGAVQVLVTRRELKLLYTTFVLPNGHSSVFLLPNVKATLLTTKWRSQVRWSKQATCLSSANMTFAQQIR
jgi:hypothetical protein